MFNYQDYKMAHFPCGPETTDDQVRFSCPDCGASTRMQEGCEFCGSCGWSKCGG